MFMTRLSRSSVGMARQGMASSYRLFHSSQPALAVQKVKTADEFHEVLKSQDKVIVDCFAEWCGPCKAIAPILEKASEEAQFKDKVHFVKFDVDQLPALSQELGVRAMPTFLFYKNGKKVDEMVGANPPMLIQALARLNA